MKVDLATLSPKAIQEMDATGVLLVAGVDSNGHPLYIAAVSADRIRARSWQVFGDRRRGILIVTSGVDVHERGLMVPVVRELTGEEAARFLQAMNASEDLWAWLRYA